MQNITKISDNLENDIKKYNLMSDDLITALNREIKLKEILK